MNSRVLVRLEWEGEKGHVHSVETHTRVVNSFGCLVVLPDELELELEQYVRVTNLDAKKGSAGVVVWKGSRVAEGWELGIELVTSDPDFWGLEL